MSNIKLSDFGGQITFRTNELNDSQLLKEYFSFGEGRIGKQVKNTITYREKSCHTKQVQQPIIMKI